MALPVVVPVGDDTADALREKLIPAIAGLRVGVSTDPEAHYGPVVSKAHKERIEHYIQMGIDEGAELVVDGRGFMLQGHEDGFFIGPTLFDHVKPSMKSYQEEIFGPVLQIVRATNFEEAVRLPSEHEYGNGVAIFTRNGHAAREFAARVNVGMVGDQRADPGAGQPTTASAAGSARASATSASTGRKACASGPRTRSSPSAGPTAAATARTLSTSRHLPDMRWLVAALLLLFAAAPAAADKRIALTFDDVPRGRGAFFTPDERTIRLIARAPQGRRQAGGILYRAGPGRA